ncbi:MAG: hypothetical protein HKN76_01730 [Saprospiraceae bacterium]|nr:hypothetical protein [Saprospiraceae bacterium]
MLFKDVVAQDEVKDFLRKAITSRRLPHALLFLGETGKGTLSMALALAQYILCENRADIDACGVCNHCHKAGKYIHPDIHFTYPTIGSKMTSGDLLPEWRKFLGQGSYQNVQEWYAAIDGENKQGNITKSECDRILKILSLKTFEGSHKILIIWMAEFLGAQGNRLLKILEEPPENTHFILIAERQDELLNTILSRCQIISFRPVPDPAIARYLMETSVTDRNTATQIAYLSEGNIIEAMTLSQHTNEKITDLWIEWMRIAYKGYGLEVNPWVDAFSKLNRESQKAFMHFGLHFLRELLLFKVDNSHTIRLLEREKKALIKMSDIINSDTINKIIDMIEQNVFHLERNINSKILLLDNSIRIHYLLRNQKQQLSAVLSV